MLVKSINKYFLDTFYIKKNSFWTLENVLFLVQEEFIFCMNANFTFQVKNKKKKKENH